MCIVFMVDKIMAANETSAYHPDLKPTELIWTNIKQPVAANDTKFCTNDNHLWEQRFK